MFPPPNRRSRRSRPEWIRAERIPDGATTSTNAAEANIGKTDTITETATSSAADRMANSRGNAVSEPTPENSSRELIPARTGGGQAGTRPPASDPSTRPDSRGTDTSASVSHAHLPGSRRRTLRMTGPTKGNTAPLPNGPARDTGYGGGSSYSTVRTPGELKTRASHCTTTPPPRLSVTCSRDKASIRTRGRRQGRDGREE